MRRPVLTFAICAVALLAASIGVGQATTIRGVGKFVTGRVHDDGTLTVGQTETILLSKMLPKTKFEVLVAPTVDTPGCGDKHPCISEAIAPAPGTPPFRTNGKGRASATFVVPATYEIQSLKPPFATQPASFVNGQSVAVGAFQIQRRHKQFKLGTAVEIALVEVTPPPAP